MLPMVLPEPTACAQAKHVATEAGLSALALTNALLAFLPLIIICVLLLRRDVKKVFVLLNTNSKVLLGCAASLLALHSFFECSLCTKQFYVSLKEYADPCNYRWTTAECISLKIPVFFCVFGFSLLHFGVFLERFWATFALKSYARSGAKPGLLIVTCSVLSALIIMYIVYHSDDLSAMRAYCMSTTSITAPKFTNAIYAATLVDVIATVGDLCIWKECRRRLKNRVHENYTLESAYRTRENLLTIRLIAPISSIHSVFYLFYLCLSAVTRSLVIEMPPERHIFWLNVNHTAICVYVITVLAAAIYRFRFLSSRELKLPDTSTNEYFRQLDVLFDRAEQPCRSDKTLSGKCAIFGNAKTIRNT